MKKTKKNGFTIVELVIVIAVIAILIAVLIPTFSKIIGKANESNDTQIVRQLNTAIEIESVADESKKPVTMYDANQITKDYGLDVAKLTAKSKLSIAWDCGEKRFVLLDEEAEKYVFPIDSTKVDQGDITNKLNFFVARQTIEDANGYSVYAGVNWNADETTIPELTVGFDAGDVSGITSITYKNETSTSQDVVIRTNSYDTELSIDDKTESKILHYGVAGALNIIECHTASYHEYGKVSFAEIAKGRIALEAGSEVTKLHFDATTQQDFDQIIVAADPSVTLPEFSRDEAVIGENGTLVVELQDSTDIDNHESDYIWLYCHGSIYEIVVTEKEVDGITGDYSGNYSAYSGSSDNVVEEGKLGVTEKTFKTQKAAVEIANNYIGSDLTEEIITIGGKEFNAPYYLEDAGDIYLFLMLGEDNEFEEVGLSDEAKEELKTAIKTEEKYANCEHEFDEDGVCIKCGFFESGTEQHPIKITTQDEFEGILNASGDATVYYALENDVEITTSINISGLATNVVLDLNGHNLVAKKASGSGSPDPSFPPRPTPPAPTVTFGDSKLTVKDGQNSGVISAQDGATVKITAGTWETYNIEGATISDSTLKNAVAAALEARKIEEGYICKLNGASGDTYFKTLAEAKSAATSSYYLVTMLADFDETIDMSLKTLSIKIPSGISIDESKISNAEAKVTGTNYVAYTSKFSDSIRTVSNANNEFNMGNSTVKMLSNITCEGAHYLRNGITLDMNGYNLTFNSSNSGFFRFVSGYSTASFTVTDTSGESAGTISMQKNGAFMFEISQNSEFTINFMNGVKLDAGSSNATALFRLTSGSENNRKLTVNNVSIAKGNLLLIQNSVGNCDVTFNSCTCSNATGKLCQITPNSGTMDVKFNNCTLTDTASSISPAVIQGTSSATINLTFKNTTFTAPTSTTQCFSNCASVTFDNATVTGKVDTGVTTIIYKNNSTVNGDAQANTED